MYENYDRDIKKRQLQNLFAGIVVVFIIWLLFEIFGK